MEFVLIISNCLFPAEEMSDHKRHSETLMEVRLFNKTNPEKGYFLRGFSFIIIEEKRLVIITGIFVAVVLQHWQLKAGVVKKTYGLQRRGGIHQAGPHMTNEELGPRLFMTT